MKDKSTRRINLKSTMLVLASVLCVNIIWAQHVPSNDNMYWLRYRTSTFNTYFAPMPVDFNKRDEYAKSRNFNVVTQTTQQFTKRGKAKKVKKYSQYTFDTEGRVAQLAVGKTGKPASWAKEFSYNDKNYMYKVVSTNTEGKVTSINQHDYYTEGEKHFHYFKINKRGDTTIQSIRGRRDTISQTSTDLYYKKGKLKYSWLNEYYPNGSTKQTTLYNKRGKSQYVWNFECKDEGIEVAKHKDTTAVCMSKEYDRDSILTEVHLSVDERGNTYKEVYKKNKLGNTLLYVKTNENDRYKIYENQIVYAENGWTKRYNTSQMFTKGVIDREWLTELDAEGNVTSKMVKSYKNGVLSKTTQDFYEYDSQNRPVLKKVLLADGSPQEIIQISYN